MSWSDGRRRLEEILNDVVARMVAVADLKRTRRQERELRDREQREAEQRQAALDEENRREEARGQELLRQAALWRRSERLRVYIDAIERAATAQGVRFVPDSEPQRWFAWARGYADQLDPLKAGFPASWTGPVEGLTDDSPLPRSPPT